MQLLVSTTIDSKLSSNHNQRPAGIRSCNPSVQWRSLVIFATVALSTLALTFASVSFSVGQESQRCLPQPPTELTRASPIAPPPPTRLRSGISLNDPFPDCIDKANEPVAKQNSGTQQALPKLPTLPPSNAQLMAQLEDIKALRAQMGGGVSEYFKGVSGASSAERQFDTELRKAAGIPAPPATERVQVQAMPSGVTTETDSSVKGLRSAARHLDQAAAELEDIGMYVDADAMRERAKALRIRARR